MIHNPYSNYHSFLIDADGTLGKGAKLLPKIRAYISDLPDTASTFHITDLPVSNPSLITHLHIELCKGWPFHSIYGPTNGKRRFVIPHAVHANRFSDVVVTCACGAQFVKNYETGDTPIENNSEHKPSCMPFDRLRARGDANEQRYKLIRRCGWLGWKGPHIGPRLGVSKNHVSGYARDYNFTLRENFTQYRRAVGRTSAYLIVHGDADLQLMADIYGHSVRSIRTWAKEYSAYTTQSGNQHTTPNSETTISPPPHVSGETAPDTAYVWDMGRREYVRQHEVALYE